MKSPKHMRQQEESDSVHFSAEMKMQIGCKGYHPERRRGTPAVRRRPEEVMTQTETQVPRFARDDNLNNARSQPVILYDNF